MASARFFEVLVQAGNAARSLDDETTAAAYYPQTGVVRPDSWIPPYNLACLRAVHGDPHAVHWTQFTGHPLKSCTPTRVTADPA